VIILLFQEKCIRELCKTGVQPGSEYVAFALPPGHKQGTHVTPSHATHAVQPAFWNYPKKHPTAHLIILFAVTEPYWQACGRADGCQSFGRWWLFSQISVAFQPLLMPC